MAPAEELSCWLRRLNVAMWLLAGGAVLLEASSVPGPFPLECVAWSGLAYGLCWLSFAYTQRLAGRPGRRGALLAVAMTVQLAMVLFLVSYWQGVSGGFLLVLTAWQGALLWPLGRSLWWVALQTASLALVVLPRPDRGMSLLMSAIIGGLQAFAVLAAHTSRRESEARLAVARAHAELREAQAMLQQTTRDAERLRLARELHDGMGHTLTALALDLEAGLHQTDGRARDVLVRARRLVGAVLAEVREVVTQLRMERPADLRSALDAVTAGIRTPQVHLELVGPVDGLDAPRSHALVRCVQELVTNALKHANARNLWIRVAVTDGAVELSVSDDGCGATSCREGHGLSGIRERVSQLSGRVEIDAARPGFAATVWLPRGGAAA